ncbi:hypothetical protein ACGFZC_01370 [[Kitasatospora] papulosa]|uniref:hypothetical protein n=1 Tax=[Kitasatospora] papulosa TaxID=1464011 RepID=UPI0036B44895
MNTRAAIVELLHAGVSNHNIASEVSLGHRAIAAIRAELGLPNARAIKGPPQVDDLFWRRTQPVDGGHLAWTGHRNNTGVAAIRIGGRMYTARRIAFRLRWHREPAGRVTTSCDFDGCVHPDHVEDQPMRDQYTAIFGKAAA